ncbi:ABC transporter ATP-binding protein [Youhaiella tibetensis]|uniref:ABC transporter ATP-binding protein n=1 Tax=Paradevosia tibetensis TaxID=1447062 RepID=A0A5B9DMV4_9HYPH|nr:ABC transporter ATP-binding protein [Youhaiella tibetensis]QEE20164.1 ABC transporter ATP-binding protein [Youhaiella tibetensis]GGF26575.1 ABC transporter ATP-binding protein [Youhaiella tibetensis]
MTDRPEPSPAPRKGSIVDLLRPYWPWIAGLVLLTIGANSLNLVGPRIIAAAIDGIGSSNLSLSRVVIEFSALAAGIFVLAYGQAVFQTFTSERVARDLRTRLVGKIASQDFAYVQRTSPARLLTNLTSDVDAIKSFVSQAIASIVSSFFLIVGASTLLLLLNWRLALVVLCVVPVIAVTFYYVLGRVRKLFRKSQEAIDWLNRVINESILGSSLIRLLNSQAVEYDKFLAANGQAMSIGMSILRLFAALIPVITFCTNLATLAIVALGGHFVISGAMTLGDFTAFNAYLSILIFPILVIGFMSNVVAQATASYDRIVGVLEAPEPRAAGTLVTEISGDVAATGLTVRYGQHVVLDDVSLVAPAGTRTAVIGPTAAGKTQLLFAITGLITPEAGTVTYDGVPIEAYDKQSLHQQVGLVFQDSVMFNLTLRENIAFSKTVDDASLAKAIATAELHDFIATLPLGLDTVISERGTSLSGGQKQRIMLARALALDPKVLLLDDFTARVDARTERRILANVRANYPGITLISVTQKIAPVEDFDQIVLLMEGKLLASGTHRDLLASSPEYVQIYSSQQSTQDYELQA